MRSVRIMTTRSCASTIKLPRRLPSRNISVGMPFKVVITTFRENTKRAVERENFANTSPVASAVSVRPVIDSSTITTFAAGDSGYMAP